LVAIVILRYNKGLVVSSCSVLRLLNTQSTPESGHPRGDVLHSAGVGGLQAQDEYHAVQVKPRDHLARIRAAWRTHPPPGVNPFLDGRSTTIVRLQRSRATAACER
jgi:hypothetical protein